MDLFRVRHSVRVCLVVKEGASTALNVAVFRGQFLQCNSVYFLDFHFKDGCLCLEDVRSLVLPVLNRPIARAFVVVHQDARDLGVAVFPWVRGEGLAFAFAQLCAIDRHRRVVVRNGLFLWGLVPNLHPWDVFFRCCACVRSGVDLFVGLGVKRDRHSYFAKYRQ